MSSADSGPPVPGGPGFPGPARGPLWSAPAGRVPPGYPAGQLLGLGVFLLLGLPLLPLVLLVVAWVRYRDRRERDQRGDRHARDRHARDRRSG